MQKTIQKIKTQTTLNSELQAIVSLVQSQHPIFSLNQSIDFLIAKGSGVYLDEMGLSIQDLKDIEQSRKEISLGKSTKANNIDEFLQKLKA